MTQARQQAGREDTERLGFGAGYPHESGEEFILALLGASSQLGTHVLVRQAGEHGLSSGPVVPLGTGRCGLRECFLQVHRDRAPPRPYSFTHPGLGRRAARTSRTSGRGSLLEPLVRGHSRGPMSSCGVPISRLRVRTPPNAIEGARISHVRRKKLATPTPEVRPRTMPSRRERKNDARAGVLGPGGCGLRMPC